MKEEFHVDPAWREVLGKNRLDDFRLLMHGKIGERVSGSGSSEVRRLVVDGEEL